MPPAGRGHHLGEVLSRETSFDGECLDADAQKYPSALITPLYTDARNAIPLALVGDEDL